MIKRFSVFFIKLDRLFRANKKSYIFFVENIKKIYYSVKINIKFKII